MGQVLHSPIARTEHQQRKNAELQDLTPFPLSSTLLETDSEAGANNRSRVVFTIPGYVLIEAVGMRCAIPAYGPSDEGY